jgi:phosphate transport system substrate-binding protein
MRSARALMFLPLFTLAGCAGCGSNGSGPAEAEVKGVGATFVQPIMKDWTESYLKVTGDKVKVNYDAKGSGAGITAMTNKEAEFGCSDAPMKKGELDEAVAKGGEVIHVPTVIGAVVPVYNLKGVDKPLVFSGPVLADVFAGKITKWNDPKLKELNKGVDLPDTAIKPVYRADKSGTSFIFTWYLGKVSPEFKAGIPPSTEPKWPITVGSKEQGSKGVADGVARAEGAIGYVELTYALDNKITYGAVLNKKGKAITATLESITAAAAASLGTKPTDEPYSLHDLTYDLSDADGDESYPIAAMSFAVLYKKQPEGKGKAAVEFLRWATTSEKGQTMAKVRNFAPLPEELRKKIGEALDTVEYVK